MALGTPVIATAWSGNLTFMREEDCHLVPATTTSVGAGHFPYDPDSLWADPDLDAAAHALRTVVEEPAAARARAAHAQARVLHDFSLAQTGDFIRNRLAATRVGRPRTTPEAVHATDPMRRLAARLLPGRRL